MVCFYMIVRLMLRFCFVSQQLHVGEGDFTSAITLLSRGAEYAARKQADYTKLLFLLSKGMVSLIKLGILEH